jgi:acyl-CoA thioesterase-2
MADGSTDILQLLDLERVEQGVFMGRPSEDGRSRVFGGHTIAQALAAACFSVEGVVCNSMHAYFVRPGIPGRPTHYEVSAMRDGSSFATRQVIAVQRDEVVLHMVASFHAPTPSPFDHAIAMPAVPAPETFPGADERIERLLAVLPPEAHEHVKRQMPFEFIRVNDFDPEADPELARTRPNRQWLRLRSTELPNDDNFHCCALAYASDAGPLEPCARAVGAAFADSSLQIASLDHAVWFHRPLRFDDWMLFVYDSPSVAGARAFGRGSVFTRKGELVASIAQEGVLRQRA